MMFQFKKFRFAALTLLALAVFLTSCQMIPAGSDVVPATGGEIPEVVIRGLDFSYDTPAQIQSGMNYIRFINDGQEIHHVQLIRLNDDVTLDEFNAALAQSEEAAMSLITLTGGVGVLDPGGEGRVLVDLDPGQYVLACFIAGEDGVPHLAKGMLTPVQVVEGESATAAAEVEADGEVVMEDFHFVLPEQIQRGEQIWRVTNNGPQPHEIMIMRLADGKTVEDVEAFFTGTAGGPPPFESLGGMQGLSMGKSAWLELDLQPGNYLATCNIPDPATGKAHADLGMVTTFTVE